MLHRILLSVVAVVLIGVVATNASAQTATYDANTGEITFDGFDQIAGMRLFSASGSLAPGAGNDLGFALTEKTATLYSWLTFATPISGDGLSAGIIAPAGWDEAQALQDLSFDYKAGTFTAVDTPGTVRWVGDIVITPEPGTFVLAGLGLVGLGLIRRRKA
jgi:hypothetical protein